MLLSSTVSPAQEHQTKNSYPGLLTIDVDLTSPFWREKKKMLTWRKHKGHWKLFYFCTSVVSGGLAFQEGKDGSLSHSENNMAADLRALCQECLPNRRGECPWQGQVESCAGEAVLKEKLWPTSPRSTKLHTHGSPSPFSFLTSQAPQLGPSSFYLQLQRGHARMS